MQRYILNADGYYSFTQNYDAGRHQKPPQIDFSFTRNYEASHYQSPPAPTKFSKLESMLQQMLEGQQKFAVEFNGKLDNMYADLNGKLEALSTHVKKLDIQAAQHAEYLRELEEFDQDFAAELPVSIDTTHQCRSTQLRFSESDGHRAPASIDTHPVSVDTTDHDSPNTPCIDRCTPCIDRHSSPPVIPHIEKLQSVEERAYKPKVPFTRNTRKSQQELYEAKCMAIMNKLIVEIPLIDAIKTTPVVKRCLKEMLTQDISEQDSVIMTSEVCSAIVQNRIPDFTLHPPPKKQRYTLPEPKPPDFINKTFKTTKTVLQLTKPRDSRRRLVSRFDDSAGKRSVPPIFTCHPSAAPSFLGRPHALNAYTPPWMRRQSSARHSLPHSRPPDA